MIINLALILTVLTVISGIVPLITGWKNDNALHREVFVNIPGPIKVVFYTVIPVLLVWGAFQFANRMKNWERGAPAQRRTTAKNAKKRAEDFRAGVYMQTLLRDSAAGLRWRGRRDHADARRDARCGRGCCGWPRGPSRAPPGCRREPPR